MPTMTSSGFLLGIFSGGAKSIVMQISIVIVFGPNFREGQKFSGGQTASGGRPCPPWKKASHNDVVTAFNLKINVVF